MGGLHDFSTKARGSRLAARGSRLAALAIASGLVFISERAGALPPDAITESLVGIDHTAAHPPVDVYVTADGRVHADIRCAGCLLNASVQSWTALDGPATQDVPGESRIDLDVSDRFTFTPADAKDARVFAWEVVLDAANDRGEAQTVRQTFFGKFVRGAFLTSNWEEYATSNRFAEFRDIGSERQFVLLNGGTVEVRVGEPPPVGVDEGGEK
jgi:hypothetical protein